MNKKGLIILIVFLSIACVVMTGVFIYLLTSNFEWGSINFNLGEPKLIESNKYESLDGILIDTKAIDVIVETSEDDTIITEVYSNDNVDYSETVVDNKLTLKVHTKSSFRLFSFGQTQKVVVKLPKDYSNEFVIDAKVGDIKLDSFENLDAVIKNSTGDLHAKNLNSADIDLTTGDINVENVNVLTIKHNTGDIDINTVDTLKYNGQTGDLKINSVTNSFDITSQTGDIKINNADFKADSKIEHKTGDIKIKNVTGAYVKIDSNDRKAELTCTINNNVGDIKIN